MDLKDFIEDVLISIDQSVSAANKKMERKVMMSQTDENRTVEFDIAVTAESLDGATGQGGVKVLGLFAIGGKLLNEQKNSTISRVRFGVQIGSSTK